MDNLKIAVVTGGSRGIGQSIGQHLEHTGYIVIYSSRTINKPDTATAIHIPCDISSPTDRASLLNEAITRFDKVDLLINNAGIAPAARRDILDISPDDFNTLLAVNLEGTFFMSQVFARQMLSQPKDQGNYRIVNISSISSYTASTNRGEYCISKAGVAMTTQLFAARLAGEGIGVFEIRPGIIETDMTAAVADKYRGLIADGLTPINRLGQPDDVARAVAAIAEGCFDFAPGQVFNIDGGFHLRRL